MKISSRIVDWYIKNGRKLPWRDIKDPFFIWASEIIMQQTRVQQGYAYFERFIQKFPTVTDLAQAHENEVLKAWEGLGYYSRARNFQKAAKIVAGQGQFPQTVQEWEALPGVGPYTARAIVSFAFGGWAAPVDGNVYRIISRHEADSTPIDSAIAKKHFQKIADTWLDPDVPTPQHNSALMDLGSAVCTPRNPKCNECPLNETCRAFALRKPEAFPVKEKTKIARERFFHFFWVQNNEGAFLIRQRDDSSYWKKLHELPNQEVENFNGSLENGQELMVFFHQFTHFKMNIRVVGLPPESYVKKEDEFWITPVETKDLPFSKPILTIMERLLEGKEKQNLLF